MFNFNTFKLKHNYIKFPLYFPPTFLEVPLLQILPWSSIFQIHSFFGEPIFPHYHMTIFNTYVPPCVALPFFRES